MAGPRVFVVGGMSQLADYVYRDYHARIQALNSQVQHTSVSYSALADTSSNVTADCTIFASKGTIETVALSANCCTVVLQNLSELKAFLIRNMECPHKLNVALS